MVMNRIVVVGGSVAGLRAVETLRLEGFEGAVTLVCGEPHLPYDRPPLTKQILTGEINAEQLCYRDHQWFERNAVDLCLGTPASALDISTGRVHLGSNSIPFDGLIVATGARPKSFSPRSSLRGISTLRTVDDALAIKERMLPGVRMILVGAGFIGSEIASSAAACGVQVTIVELAEAAMIRAVGPKLGRILAGLHDEVGVNAVCNARVTGFGGKGSVEAVMLDGGWELPADIVVVGIGVDPNCEWLIGSGLRIEDGLACDRTLNAGPRNVYGAGDVVSWPNEWWGGVMRGQQWLVAADQGKHAARNLLAGHERATPFSTIPYFWTDQYGCRVQAAGRTDLGQLIAVAGGHRQRPFIGVYRHNGKLTGVVTINAPKAFAALRTCLHDHSSFDTAWEVAVKNCPPPD